MNPFYKRFFIYFIVVLSAGTVNAQRHMFLGVFGGLSNYKGDLGSKMFPSRPDMVGGGSMLFELNHRMIIRAEFNYGKLHGGDQMSAKNRMRNLDFTSKVSEAALEFEYILFDLYEHRASPYFFAGVGTFKFSPYTIDKNGYRVMLAEQSTEGQGFFDGRRDYKLQKLCFPFGGGVQLALNPRQRVAFEVGFRKTTTDYLDDVSTTYIDQELLSRKKGNMAANIAYRGDEIAGGGSYPAEGTRRGNPNNKDWYSFTGISYRFSLQPSIRRSRYTYRPHRARTSCPKF